MNLSPNKVEGRSGAFSRPLGPVRRAGVTLIEMLVVIAVIAVIAAVSIGALMVIPEHARTRGTEALVAKINSKLVQRLDQFNSRRDSIRTLASCDLPLANNEPSLAHVIAIVRTMRQEFPESFDLSGLTDGFDNNGDGNVDEAGELIADWNPVNISGTAAPEQSLAEQPSAAAGHLAYVRRVFNSNFHRPDTTRAECLYMIVTADGADTAEFAPGEIADTDGDGLPEFVDKFGQGQPQPIQFFLWPTNYTSPRQKPDAETNPDDPNQLLTENRTPGTSWWSIPNTATTPIVTAPRARFEQLFFSLSNSTGSGPQAYRTYPLIISAGSDGGFGLVEVSTGVIDRRAFRITNATQDGYGMDADNIENHSLRVR